MPIRRAATAATRTLAQLLIITSLAIVLFSSRRSLQFFEPYVPVTRFDPLWTFYLQQRTTTSLAAWLSGWVPWSMILSGALLTGLAAVWTKGTGRRLDDTLEAAVLRFMS